MGRKPNPMEKRAGSGEWLTDHVYYFTHQIVNVFFILDEHDPDTWVIVDAGMPRSASRIIREAANVFGKDAEPSALFLTHGHFDHTGGIKELVERWQMPVFAHREELPYVLNQRPYPAPDPTVQGGLIAKASRFFPRYSYMPPQGAKALPEDGSVPYLDDWRVIHTPGHTPGHVSFYHGLSRTLIAGDAVCTVKQDRLLDVVTQDQHVTVPPVYFTPDWEEAERSLKRLAELSVHHLGAGHGTALHGCTVSKAIRNLSDHFQEECPKKGRYLPR
ncbi:MBL fold metallo-hydrolase [Bacillus daqingensis]|uniref:MBL fold metallo-hydrolase n=1 Tax=Bacillus daqingensis TaxID=872396 RepID=A0ABV9NZ32_9BACI